MTLITLTPSTEPVSVAEAKLALRFTSSALDAEIGRRITSAREVAEHLKNVAMQRVVSAWLVNPSVDDLVFGSDPHADAKLRAVWCLSGQARRGETEMSQAGPDTYKRLFENSADGTAVLEDLVTRFSRAQVSKGGIDAILKTYENGGAGRSSITSSLRSTPQTGERRCSSSHTGS